MEPESYLWLVFQITIFVNVLYPSSFNNGQLTVHKNPFVESIHIGYAIYINRLRAILYRMTDITLDGVIVS